MPRRARPSQRGFSLIEILIAVTIIVLMGGLVAINVFPQLFQTQRDKASIDIENLKKAVELFHLRERRLPNESEWPDFLLQGSKNNPDPYIEPDRFEGGEVKDPWGTPYVYRKLSSTTFEILSYGADQQPGGDGDGADISSKQGRKD
jgi:general secretion pathway protein G